jgi:hypothetical protein
MLGCSFQASSEIVILILYYVLFEQFITNCSFLGCTMMKFVSSPEIRFFPSLPEKKIESLTGTRDSSLSRRKIHNLGVPKFQSDGRASLRLGPGF